LKACCVYEVPLKCSKMATFPQLMIKRATQHYTRDTIAGTPLVTLYNLLGEQFG